MSVFQTEGEGPIPSSRTMHKYCYVDGWFTILNKPQIKLNDLSLLRGYAVFDFVKIIKGRPLFWPEHLARFRHSAKLLGLTFKFSDQNITTIVNKLLVKNKVKNGSVRLI